MIQVRPRREATGKETIGLVRNSLEELFRQNHAWVFNLARRMLSNDADAEDVAQEVFLQVAKRLHTFRGEANITTWLYRVTVNATLMCRRRTARRRDQPFGRAVDKVFSDTARFNTVARARTNPEQCMLDRERRQVIEDAVAALPIIYRDVFILADIEGLPNLEIGKLLRLRLAAVKSRLHRGRMILRNTLAPYFFQEAEAIAS